MYLRRWIALLLLPGLLMDPALVRACTLPALPNSSIPVCFAQQALSAPELNVYRPLESSEARAKAIRSRPRIRLAPIRNFFYNVALSHVFMVVGVGGLGAGGIFPRSVTRNEQLDEWKEKVRAVFGTVPVEILRLDARGYRNRDFNRLLEQIRQIVVKKLHSDSLYSDYQSDEWMDVTRKIRGLDLELCATILAFQIRTNGFLQVEGSVSNTALNLIAMTDSVRRSVQNATKLEDITAAQQPYNEIKTINDQLTTWLKAIQTIEDASQHNKEDLLGRRLRDEMLNLHSHDLQSFDWQNVKQPYFTGEMSKLENLVDRHGRGIRRYQDMQPELRQLREAIAFHHPERNDPQRVGLERRLAHVEQRILAGGPESNASGWGAILTKIREENIAKPDEAPNKAHDEAVAAFLELTKNVGLFPLTDSAPPTEPSLATTFSKFMAVGPETIEDCLDALLFERLQSTSFDQIPQTLQAIVNDMAEKQDGSTQTWTLEEANAFINTWWGLAPEERQEMMISYSQSENESFDQLAQAWRSSVEALGHTVRWWSVLQYVNALLLLKDETDEAVRDDVLRDARQSIALTSRLLDTLHLPTLAESEIDRESLKAAHEIVDVLYRDQPIEHPWALRPADIAARRLVLEEQQRAAERELVRWKNVLEARASRLNRPDLEKQASRLSSTSEAVRLEALLDSLNQKAEDDARRLRDAEQEKSKARQVERQQAQQRSRLAQEAAVSDLLKINPRQDLVGRGLNDILSDVPEGVAVLSGAVGLLDTLPQLMASSKITAIVLVDVVSAPTVEALIPSTLVRHKPITVIQSDHVLFNEQVITLIHEWVQTEKSKSNGSRKTKEEIVDAVMTRLGNLPGSAIHSNGLGFIAGSTSLFVRSTLCPSSSPAFVRLVLEKILSTEIGEPVDLSAYEKVLEKLSAQVDREQNVIGTQATNGKGVLFVSERLPNRTNGLSGLFTPLVAQIFSKARLLSDVSGLSAASLGARRELPDGMSSFKQARTTLTWVPLTPQPAVVQTFIVRRDLEKPMVTEKKFVKHKPLIIPGWVRWIPPVLILGILALLGEEFYLASKRSALLEAQKKPILYLNDEKDFLFHEITRFNRRWDITPEQAQKILSTTDFVDGPFYRSLFGKRDMQLKSIPFVRVDVTLHSVVMPPAQIHNTQISINRDAFVPVMNRALVLDRLGRHDDARLLRAIFAGELLGKAMLVKGYETEHHLFDESLKYLSLFRQGNIYSFNDDLLLQRVEALRIEDQLPDLRARSDFWRAEGLTAERIKVLWSEIPELRSYKDLLDQITYYLSTPADDDHLRLGLVEFSTPAIPLTPDPVAELRKMSTTIGDQTTSLFVILELQAGRAIIRNGRIAALPGDEDKLFDDMKVHEDVDPLQGLNIRSGPKNSPLPHHRDNVQRPGSPLRPSIGHRPPNQRTLKQAA